MFEYSQLAEYYKGKNEMVSSRMALVEYLQYELLDSLYKQKDSEYLSFMGGTAIRIGYHGNRFSEDLDFDNAKLSFSDFKVLFDNVVEDMRVKGFQVEFRYIKKMAYHCYIKFPHILHEHKISDHAEEKINIQIDSVRRDNIVKPKILTINQFDIYRDILINSPEVILSQKLMAALERKRPKGRDFYDISFLYGITQPDEEYLEKIVGSTLSEVIKKLNEYCKTLNFHELAKDVQPFLIKKDQDIRVIDFPRFIAQKL